MKRMFSISPYILVLSFFLIFSSSSQAKRFRNAYVSFELPEKWNCKIEGTEWVCSNTFNKNSAREAIIILTAKEAGPSDNLEAYRLLLQKPRLLPSRGGSPVRSKVLHVKNRKVANQNWVDGMHKGSEIPNYYTRYLGTVKDKVAILVTFTAHTQHYTKYSSDFFRAIQSLRVIASKSLIQRQNLAPVAPSGEIFGVRSADAPVDFGEDLPSESSSPQGDGASKILGVILLALAGGGYFYLKKKGK